MKRLEPGASAFIRFAHSHGRAVDEDAVPVVLQIKGGKSILLNLTGATHAADVAPLLHPHCIATTLSTISHQLAPAKEGRR